MYSAYSQMTQKKSSGCQCVCAHAYIERDRQRAWEGEKIEKLMGQNANREFWVKLYRCVLCFSFFWKYEIFANMFIHICIRTFGIYFFCILYLSLIALDC